MVTIYMPLRAEGTDVWRPVEAEPQSGDIYRIVGAVPVDEDWRFSPGAFVFCESRILDGRQATVAVREPNWLEDIVLVNESGDPLVAGDVSVFRSAGDACQYLEHWWVEQNEGFAFSATGERLLFGVDAARRVVVRSRESCPEGEVIVTSWLFNLAVAVRQARRAHAAKGKVSVGDLEKVGVLPTTIEGLIAYVGFTT